MLGPDRYPLWMTEASLRHYADVIEHAVVVHRPDAVLAISSQCLIRLHATLPLYMFNDAPWPVFKRTYSRWETSPLHAARFSREECAATAKCRAVFTGSDWAVAEARKIYAIAPERIYATPLGANWVPPLSTPELLQIAGTRAALLSDPQAPLQLLFVGKDWERKGGPLALEVATLLHQRGRAVRFHIVGPTPSIPAAAAAFTTLHGLLNLDNPAQRAQLQQLYLDSHFLLVPTQAECYGIVFAEAQAFAVPPISRNIDALPTIVLDPTAHPADNVTAAAQIEATGLLLPADAPASAYADRITALIANPDAYIRMATAGRARYESLLNWNQTAATIIRHIEATL
jgi:glycosyltransferase involved in cell wall biosynthesis